MNTVCLSKLVNVKGRTLTLQIRTLRSESGGGDSGTSAGKAGHVPPKLGHLEIAITP